MAASLSLDKRLRKDGHDQAETLDKSGSVDRGLIMLW